MYLVLPWPLPWAQGSPIRVLETEHGQRPSEIDGDAEKYFHESTFHVHYDGRFATRQIPYEERHKHLVALVQTYLSSMNDIGVETVRTSCV